MTKFAPQEDRLWEEGPRAARRSGCTQGPPPGFRAWKVQGSDGASNSTHVLDDDTQIMDLGQVIGGGL